MGVTDLCFLAPEMLLKLTTCSVSTDIYALGLLFWQIATDGKKPNNPRDTLFSNPQLIRDLMVIPDCFTREVIPEDTKISFRELIKDCWKPSDSRPSID